MDNNIYSILADATLVIHFGFILFVVFGGFLVLRWRRVGRYHLPALLWGVMIEFTGWICPLTPLENWFRKKVTGTGYETGFIEHYLVAIIYPSNLTRPLQFVLGTVLVVVNLAIYIWICRRILKERRDGPP